ncbi:hypothetical protein CY35_15G104500 [Sphagnum magellanicum]|nr:hypothetical protein CY35_15G104500 [Sphagnum magellanicum]
MGTNDHPGGDGEKVLRTGWPLFYQQCISLMRKNALISYRNRRATILQIGSSLFFIFLLFCVEKASDAQLSGTTAYKNLFEPQPQAVASIPACENAYFVVLPCYDFIWSGVTSPRIQSVVNNIMNNNPNRPIPSTKVLHFDTPEEVDTWLLANPMQCYGTLYFEEQGTSAIAYGVQTNSTAIFFHGRFSDPNFSYQIPLQVAAEREIARTVLGDSSLLWNPSFTEFAHPAISTDSTVGTVGASFLLAAAMFGFVIQISNLVLEKEMRLRQMMTTMGLMDSAYWLTWLLWEVVLVFVSSLLVVCFGLLFQFDFFLHNSFGVLFFLFFMFSFNMLVTAFGFPYSHTFAVYLRALWSLFPPNLLAIGLTYLGDATSTAQDPGISWSNRGKCSYRNEDCVLTMNGIYLWLLATFFLWFVLAIYFDNVLPDVNGVRKSWFYFLSISYWTGKGTKQKEGGGCSSCVSSVPPVPENEGTLDPDVAAEEDLVKEQMAANFQDPTVAVRVQGLVKTYPGMRKRVGCCQWKKVSPYHAVKGSWFNIEKDKLFCLLGPNGAGKTTTINCLTGIIPTTAGDGLVYGDSIRSTAGIANIRKNMGVCPQGTEELLSQVKLVEAANVRAGSYSGGMKRRLSVAIALIGDPKVVYLDEPTTGMDPVTRRHVWDIIEASKKGRAIILTTHSMEEADILGDRVAIMARGKLRCIGTPIRLKTRFGAGYVVNVSVRSENSTREPAQLAEEEQQRSKVKQFFKEKLAVEPKEENQAYTTFIIPRDRESQLPEFFRLLEDHKAQLGVTDLQMGLTTLEEVFLTITKQADLENAAAEGRVETLTVDGQTMNVPIGTQYIMVPNSISTAMPNGLMVEIYWQQDDEGALRISGQSEPIPATVPSLGANPL